MTVSKTPEEIAGRLEAKFGDRILETDLEAARIPIAWSSRWRWRDRRYCRDELGFNYLRCLSGVDYIDKKKTTDDLGVSTTWEPSRTRTTSSA